MKSLNLFSLMLFCFTSLLGQSFINGPYTDKFIGQPLVADFNGDEKLDVVGVSRFFSLEGDLQLHNNVTESGVINFETLDLELEVLGDPGFGDFDGDGDLDLVVTGKVDSTVLILLNDGDGAFLKDPQISEAAYSFRVSDLDGDDDIDIVSFNEFESSAYIMINDGHGKFQTMNLITNEDDLKTIELGDIDKDNDVDIIVGFDYFFDAKIIVLENSGGASFEEESITDFAIAGLENIQIVDVDKDGDNDVAYSSYETSSLRILINDGNQVFTEMNLVQGAGGVRSFNITDYNTDGILDIIIGCNSDDVTYHQGQSSGSLMYTTEVISGIQPLFFIVNGDLDSDNDLDAVLSNGDFWWIRNDLEQFHVSTTELDNSLYSIFPNPFTSFIDINTQLEHKEIMLCDLYGKILLRLQGNSFPLDLEFLHKGLYYLSITDQKSGEIIQASKLIKI